MKNGPPSLHEQMRMNWQENWQLFVALVIVGLILLYGWSVDAPWWRWLVETFGHQRP